MSTPTVNPINVRYPFELRDQPHEVVQAHRFAFQGLVDLNQALAAIKSQINSIKTGTATTIVSGGGGSSTIITNNTFPGLGGLRDLTGLTSYTTVTPDNGILLLINDASPVAISLNSGTSIPFFLFATNFGAGSATFTPTSGTINGSASFILPQNFTTMIVFDGTNWETSALLVLPQTKAHVGSQWLDSYTASTGVFTASQPAFSDISGNLAVGQLPADVPQVSFGSGAPAGSSTEGFIYFDTSGSPYHGYVFHLAAWHQFS